MDYKFLIRVFYTILIEVIPMVLTENSGVPNVTLQQSSYSVPYDRDVTLVCTVSNSNISSVHWQRNIDGIMKNITNRYNDYRYKGGYTNRPSLTISSTKESDAGIYQCFATNSLGTGHSTTTTLSVIVSVPDVQIPESDYSYKTGTHITIPFTIASKYVVTSVYWQKNVGGSITNITSDNKRFLIYFETYFSDNALQIIYTETDDTGNYTCFATNRLGTGHSTTILLSITERAPYVQVFQTFYTAIIGNSVTLGCSVRSGINITNVYWEKNVNGKITLITSTTNITKYNGSTTSTASLTIFDAAHSDRGSYVCFGSNSIGTRQSTIITLYVVEFDLKVRAQKSSYTVTAGNSVTLVCTVTSSLTINNVYWLRNVSSSITRITSTNNTNKYNGSTTTTPSLTIFNAEQPDDGVYICLASSSGETRQSTSIQLFVTGSVLSVSISPDNADVNQGNSQLITISVTGEPAATSITWYFTQTDSEQQQTLSTGNTAKYYGGNTQNHSLTIFDFQSFDSGTYVCSATNAVGQSNSTNSVLRLNIDLKIRAQQSSYTVTAGNSVTLVCTVTSTLTINNVYWLRNVSSSITRITSTNNTNKYNGSTTTTPSLTIFNAEQPDDGVYICLASSSGETRQSTSIQLFVTGSVLSVSISPDNADVNQGNSQLITISVTGEPAATSITWYFTQTDSEQQQTLSTGNTAKYYGGNTQNHSLTIFDFQSFDSGTYACSATNAVGQINSTNSVLRLTSVLSVSISPANAVVLQGHSQLISISVTGEPAATYITWYFTPTGSEQQQILRINNAAKYYGGTSMNHSLTILDFQSFDSGTYVFSATNTVGQSNSTTSVLRLISDLNVTASLKTYSTKEGDSMVTILCKISGEPPAVEWDWIKRTFIGGDTEIIAQLTNNAKRQVINSETNPNLNIFSITTKDEGIYTCRANNGKRQFMSRPVILEVLEASPRAPPGEPETSKPLNMKEGTNVTLSCSSTGGNPPPSVVWLKDDIIITSGTNTTTSGNITTTTLTFTTTPDDDLEVYECQVDNGFLQRPLVKTTYLALNPSNKPVGQPQITGSQRYSLGDIVTLICSSTGGSPLPKVKWLRDDNVISTGIRTSSAGNMSTTTLTFTAGLEDHLEVFECQADNGVLRNPLASTEYIELYFAPKVPILTGPTNLIAGSLGKWTCSSQNGYPAPTLSMRIQDRHYTNELIVVQSYDVLDRSYTVSGTLHLVPSSDKSGQHFCCDVSNLFNSKAPQSVCLQLTINEKEEQDASIYIVTGLVTGMLVFIVVVLTILYRNGFILNRDQQRVNVIEDYDGLASNGQEVHAYNPQQDTDDNHYMTINTDNDYLEPVHGNSFNATIFRNTDGLVSRGRQMHAHDAQQVYDNNPSMATAVHVYFEPLSETTFNATVDNDGLASNEQEMHTYNTKQDHDDTNDRAIMADDEYLIPVSGNSCNATVDNEKLASNEQEMHTYNTKQDHDDTNDRAIMADDEYLIPVSGNSFNAAVENNGLPSSEQDKHTFNTQQENDVTDDMTITKHDDNLQPNRETSLNAIVDHNGLPSPEQDKHTFNTQQDNGETDEMKITKDDFNLEPNRETFFNAIV